MSEKVATVRSLVEVAPAVRVYQLEYREPKTMTFRAGQFVSIRCDARGDTRRSYSISSLPTRTDGFELLVQLVPGGVGSAYFEKLAVGDEVHFTGPQGFFVNELAHPGDALWAVTGSGIAAALPMIEEAAARSSESGRLILYWGLRYVGDIYWLDRLKAITSPRFEWHLCLSAGDGYEKGRINAHVFARVPSLEKPHFYVVGNGDMVREVRQELVQLGFDRRRQVHTEVFYPATKKA
jgi:ferredoxin-NADP reductase